MAMAADVEDDEVEGQAISHLDGAEASRRAAGVGRARHLTLTRTSALSGFSSRYLTSAQPAEGRSRPSSRTTVFSILGRGRPATSRSWTCARSGKLKSFPNLNGERLCVKVNATVAVQAAPAALAGSRGGALHLGGFFAARYL